MNFTIDDNMNHFIIEIEWNEEDENCINCPR